MKAYFKNTEKIILNSMDYTEALVAQQILDNISEGDKIINIVERYDVNDDLDGLVVMIDKTNKVETTLISVDSINLSLGTTSQVQATYAPANSTDVLQTVSSNEHIFTIDSSSASNGVINLTLTPVSVGTGILVLAMGNIITTVDVTVTEGV